MKVIGLTGSIGMGKSTIAAQLKRMGAVVVDSDAIVHRLLSPGGKAFSAVIAAFPEVLEQGCINRQQLGKIVFSQPEKLKMLEKIIHPLVREENLAAIRQAQYHRRKWVVLEIPLLFETQAQSICDEVMVVTAPAFLQKQRVLKRPGMTIQKFRQILARQVSDSQKRKLADIVINTGLGKAHSWRQLITSVS